MNFFLNKYVVAGVLASAAMLVADTAHASVIYSGPLNETHSVSNDGADTFSYSFDNTTPDVNLANQAFVSFPFAAAAFNLAEGNGVSGFTDLGEALHSGDSISTGGTLTDLVLLNVALASNDPLACAILGGCGVQGPFQNDAARFLGVNFERGGQFFAGWVRLLVHVDAAMGADELTSNAHATITLVDAAYNDDAGGSLLAGQINATQVVPEPSTLSLFGMGIVAVIATRIRRKAVN